MVNIVLPLALLLAISFGVFWLPVECGEKVSLGITVLMASSVFQLILTDNTPVSSDVHTNNQYINTVLFASKRISIGILKCNDSHYNTYLQVLQEF